MNLEGPALICSTTFGKQLLLLSVKLHKGRDGGCRALVTSVGARGGHLFRIRGVDGNHGILMSTDLWETTLGGFFWCLLNCSQPCWSCSWHASELIAWRFPCIWYRMPALRWCFTFSWLQPACSEMPACLLLAPVHSSGSAVLLPAWRGISLWFSRMWCQLSCPKSLCLESLFPHHLSSHTCLFSSSSYPRISLSFFLWCCYTKSSLGLDVEAKVVKGGRERIYSFNYRDSLNKQTKKKEYLSL